MRIAKSARVHCILGASLVAIALPGVSNAAIDSSSAQAIDSSSAKAIDSSSAQAIDSSSAQAIDSSSAQAIDSSSAQAIDSSSVLAIDSSSGQAIDSSSSQAIDSSSGPMLAGPVDGINMHEGTFTAVGQTVSFSGEGLGALQVGGFVTVYGSIAGAGRIDATGVDISSEMYVPGATEVFVTGIPSAVDFARGTARIGSLEIDYTPSLGGSGFGGIGAAITVIGTQPAFGGAMLGDSVIDRTELFLRD